MLRDHVRRGTELGRRAESIMDSGELVPDDVIVGMVGAEFDAAAELRFLLDGFPRTPAQAASLDALLADRGAAIAAAIALEVQDEELVRRLLQRAQEEGRSDDTEGTVRTRMQVYRTQTQPLLDYYDGQRKLHRVDGVGSVEEVTARLRAVLEGAAQHVGAGGRGAEA
jgi:adenylate kinase